MGIKLASPPEKLGLSEAQIAPVTGVIHAMAEIYAACSIGAVPDFNRLRDMLAEALRTGGWSETGVLPEVAQARCTVKLMTANAADDPWKFVEIDKGLEERRNQIAERIKSFNERIAAQEGEYSRQILINRAATGCVFESEWHNNKKGTRELKLFLFLDETYDKLAWEVTLDDLFFQSSKRSYRSSSSYLGYHLVKAGEWRGGRDGVGAHFNAFLSKPFLIASAANSGGHLYPAQLSIEVVERML
jgi:hypothetical protein